MLIYFLRRPKLPLHGHFQYYCSRTLLNFENHLSPFHSEQSKKMKVDGRVKWTVLIQSGRSRAIVDGLLSQSERS